MKKKRDSIKLMPTRIFLAVVLLFFIAFGLILSYIALSPNVFGTEMQEFAKTRSSYSTTLYAKRGTIFDSEGSTLALNVSSYTVIAYLSDKRTTNPEEPNHVVDKEETARLLAPILKMEEGYILDLLSRNVYQVELGPGGRGITELTKETIQALNLPGIAFVETFKRYYPNGDFASYILGYAKKYEDINKNGKISIIGELGIEAKYNEELTGIDGYTSYQRDRYGFKIPNTKEDRIEAKQGSDIKLTINSNLQRFVQSASIDIKNNYDPSWGNITIMNAKTGAILASTSIPSFDPNVRDIVNYENSLVSYAFEPGSVMKTFTYMCAIENGKYNGNKLVNTGSLKIGDDEIRDWNRVGWGQISLDKGFEYSSNLAAANIVQESIDKEELRDCLESYGFGRKTGIELNKEVNGTITFNYPIEVATASFGQGINTTVLQQLQGLSIIANDGAMVSPYLVEEITNSGKTTYKNELKIKEKVVSKSTTDKMKDLLDNVVNSEDWGATGRGYRLDGYNLIGKTGTAQISSGNGYLKGYNDYIYSFAGMYPKNDPEIIIYAGIKQPKTGGSAGVQAAVREIVVNSSKYLNIYDETEATNKISKFEVGSY